MNARKEKGEEDEEGPLQVFERYQGTKTRVLGVQLRGSWASGRVTPYPACSFA